MGIFILGLIVKVLDKVLNGIDSVYMLHKANACDLLIDDHSPILFIFFLLEDLHELLHAQ